VRCSDNQVHMGPAGGFYLWLQQKFCSLAKPAAADGPYYGTRKPKRCCAGAACNGHLFLVPSLVHCPNARDSTIGWRVARSPSRRSSLIEAGGGWQQPLPTPRPTCLLAAAKAGASQKPPNASPASSGLRRRGDPCNCAISGFPNIGRIAANEAWVRHGCIYLSNLPLETVLKLLRGG
jgi:hypothetical protein